MSGSTAVYPAGRYVPRVRLTTSAKASVVRRSATSSLARAKAEAGHYVRMVVRPQTQKTALVYARQPGVEMQYGPKRMVG